MPWTVKDVEGFNKGLSDKQKEQWVAVANSEYESCMKDGGDDATCAPKAIKMANGVVKKRGIDMEKEIRSFERTDAEVRASRRGRTIEGYGIVFNKESKDLGGFIEVIERDAIKGVFEKSDVLALLNHDESRGVLARSTNGNGTLELIVDDFGVKYRFEAPDTVLGDEVLSGVRRGDIRTSSFAFSIDKEDEDSEDWQKMEDGRYKRTIKKFREIYDISPVYREAYADTTVAVRSLIDEKTREAELEAAKAREEAEEAKRKIADLEAGQRANATPSASTEVEKPDLTEYFINLRKQIQKK